MTVDPIPLYQLCFWHERNVSIRLSFKVKNVGNPNEDFSYKSKRNHYSQNQSLIIIHNHTCQIAGQSLWRKAYSLSGTLKTKCGFLQWILIVILHHIYTSKKNPVQLDVSAHCHIHDEWWLCWLCMCVYVGESKQELMDCFVHDCVTQRTALFYRNTLSKTWEALWCKIGLSQGETSAVTKSQHHLGETNKHTET